MNLDEQSKRKIKQMEEDKAIIADQEIKMAEL
jgi:hypothetical protein